MENNVNYTLVGAFVIFLTTAMIFIIIWLSSGFTSEKFTTYEVNMHEAVSGLNVGAAVEFNGVNCGTVSRIKINPKYPQVVILFLKVRKDIPITNGTRAKLDIRSLSGTTYIQLLDRGVDLRPLKILPGKKYAIIETTPSILVKLTTTLNRISNSFQQISLSVQQLLDRENLTSIKESLGNLRKFTDVLSKNSNQVDEFLHNAATLTHSLKAQTLPEAGRAFSNISDLSEDLSHLSGEIKNNPAIIIRGRAPQPLGPGE